MADAPPAPAAERIVERPTRKSEWTLIGVLVALCCLALVFSSMILFPKWPDVVAPARVQYLGWSLLASICGILLLTIAFISPWVGTVKASGFGASLEVEGDNDTGGN